MTNKEQLWTTKSENMKTTTHTTIKTHKNNYEQYMNNIIINNI